MVDWEDQCGHLTEDLCQSRVAQILIPCYSCDSVVNGFQWIYHYSGVSQEQYLFYNGLFFLTQS